MPCQPACPVSADTWAPSAIPDDYRYADLHLPQQVGQASLAAECAVAISYNGLNQAVMMASPEDIEDFVRGFSLSSGFVESIDDIYEIRVSARANPSTPRSRSAAAHSGTSSANAGNWPARQAAACAASKPWSRRCRNCRSGRRRRCLPPSISAPCASVSSRPSDWRAIAAPCMPRCISTGMASCACVARTSAATTPSTS